MIWTDIVNGQVNNDSNDTISSLKNGKDAKDAATLDVNDFLQLLVAQMQYQDPLEPTDNTQYIAQMATFTQVEATTQMVSKTEQQMASSLVGKYVIMATNQNSSGMVAGKVDYWEIIDGTVYLGVNGRLYDIADIDTVMDEKYLSQFEDSEAGAGKDETQDIPEDGGSEEEG